jgi:mRNA interferase RelE/StbE
LAWTIEYERDALKDIKRLSRDIQNEIFDYMDNRIAAGENPRLSGKPLTGNKRGLWRYRLRNYRIVCKIQDQKLVVLVVAVGHRSTIYD